MSTGVYDYKQDVRRYLIVFFALATMTIITVAVSYIESGKAMGIAIAILIATIKASLVACYFMHLISEKKLVYLVLGLTAIFFIGLLFLPLWESHSIFEGMQHLSLMKAVRNVA